MSKFVLLTLKDPWLSPSGGTSAFASQLLKVFNGELAVVSMTLDEKLLEGQWIDRTFNGISNKYLNIKCVDYSRKRLIPLRLIFYFNILKHRKTIEKIGLDCIFIDSPEAILTLSDHWLSINYIFHGLNNPIKNSRYRFFRWIGVWFEKRQLRKMNALPIDCVLAASDLKGIDRFNKRTSFDQKIGKIISFPMSVDDRIFFCIDDKEKQKEELNIIQQKVLIAIGRLAEIKGWNLLLNSFQIFLERNPDSLLVFVGEGEDRMKIENKIKILNLQKNVRITGFLDPKKVAKYINASDLGLVGSYNEGWSVAMCEILSCGRGIVSTAISGASDMIILGKNGFIVKDRDPVLFCDYIEQALKLRDVEKTSLAIAENFRLRNLKQRIEKVWPNIKENNQE